MKIQALAVVLVLASGLHAQAQDDDHKKVLEAWGSDFVATWETSNVLDTDVAGLGKKGDKISVNGTVEKENGLYKVTLNTSLNGKQGELGLGVAGWDPKRKKVRLESFSDQGTVTTVWYTRKGDSWTSRLVSVAPDGTKSTNFGMLTISKDTHVWKLTKRMQGETELPDLNQTWTKAG